ncbi:putative Cinnamoyl-CoA reductase 1 [Cocos nucifera]|uniref:Putative Cinnamoyl-CoA reductase 1 n=1 Tax=Cocos nucifera TaxID=13894 RepID=A0A8K0IRQ4_COCNU|nr:putative Cinnamoyl-CoA reductase 1 [Cocos nucifera]
MAYNEDSWTDIDHCKKLELWYPAAKTLAERAAWEFAAKEGLDVVVINPGLVFGPMLQPAIGVSLAILLHLLQGSDVGAIANSHMGCVDVRDVALAHILLYEKPAAQGRHLCVEAITSWCDFVAKIAELYPEFQLPRCDKNLRYVPLCFSNHMMMVPYVFTGIQRINNLGWLGQRVHQKN